MDERINKIAALANVTVFDTEARRKYINGSPHIKHASLRSLYGKLVVSVYDFATRYTHTPEVLDIGAGDGLATLPFLELGAKVTAIDISKSQLKVLKEKCAAYLGNLEVRCQEVFDAIKSLQSEGKQYDIIVANSFLHHIPDYLSLIRHAVTILSPFGQFFSFQDLLKYDSLGPFALAFSSAAYFSWRLFQGDIIGGLRRYIRRKKGIYLDDCLDDNIEYHIRRHGVDQDAILDLFRQLGFECEIVCYFSTQSSIWQPIGTALGINNTFAVIARKSCILKKGE